MRGKNKNLKLVFVLMLIIAAQSSFNFHSNKVLLPRPYNNTSHNEYLSSPPPHLPQVTTHG